jgi:hypothetical protein
LGLEFGQEAHLNEAARDTATAPGGRDALEGSIELVVRDEPALPYVGEEGASVHVRLDH